MTFQKLISSLTIFEVNQKKEVILLVALGNLQMCLWVGAMFVLQFCE